MVFAQKIAVDRWMGQPKVQVKILNGFFSSLLALWKSFCAQYCALHTDSYM